MEMEPVQVMARWQIDGSFSPQQFVWQGQIYQVESTGRQWEDLVGLHVLCMVAGGRVFELVFQLNPAGWQLRPPLNRSAAV
jgi:hypothetical protein